MRVVETENFKKQLKKNPSLRDMLEGLKAKIEKYTEQQLRDNHGTHMEPIHGDPPYQSIRLNYTMRVKCIVDRDVVFFESVDKSHAYRASLVLAKALPEGHSC